MEYVRLRNGVELPKVGLGTWQIVERSLMNDVIKSAYDSGYRLIDFAKAYSNEIAVTKALREAGIGREEVILSDKLWRTVFGYEEVLDACKQSLKKLKTDYFDLYLIHWPASISTYPDWAEKNAENWRAMETLYKEGYVKAIGVSNFNVRYLSKLRETASIMPFVNQIELHPGLLQQDIVDFCQKESIQMEASSPLGSGEVLKQETLVRLGDKYGVSTAKICLRWGIQKGFVVIPKSTNPERIAGNISVFDFEISSDDMRLIDEIPYCGGIGLNPDDKFEFETYEV